ncbi:MAG: NADH-quinone oxidoreductase subunit L [Candidatus Eremiobacteraeota bacterium]|nr:NADH-quinone oxidoreductase subunit L [Candidatus Eremiobacteraeota bacterium]
MIHHVMGVDGSYPLLYLIWLLPLFGAIVCWALGPQLKSLAGAVGAATIGASFVATLLSWGAATQNGGVHGALGAHQNVASWFAGFDFGLLLDPLSLIWTLVITGVGFLIHLYSVGYMSGDRAFARFFAYMNFFVFSMLTLVLADNFVVLLVGWGLVGLASYFLIGFWFERPTAVAAARKAFVINVFGDLGMLLAILVIFAHVGSATYGDVFGNVGALSGSLFLVCACLFIAAAAKSAQVPLHTWLPDAMEGPTPVSALIHAATMVTAGVYLIARCWPLFSASPDAQMLVGTVGGLTALTGAVLGMAQWDIKRILAYSTMSQIGYMIMGVGVGAYEGGVAHFFTHAFFKAQLFLGSGLIIHALANEQDVRRMGGLRKRMPFAFLAMLVGVLAICGIPGLAGSFSKDAVIQGALEHGHPWLYAVGILTAGLTAYYMFRMLFLTFFGEYRGEIDPSNLGLRHPELAGTPMMTVHDAHDAHDAHDDEHHAPAWLMNVPVGILIVPSILAGWLLWGGEHSPWHQFFAAQFRAETLGAPVSELVTTLIVLAVVAAGIGVAYIRYASAAALSDAPARIQRESVRMPAALSQAFYFDTALDLLFVKPAMGLGLAFGRWLDPHVIDGAVREAVISSRWLGHFFRSMQTGLVRAYALMIVFGAACFIAYYAFAGGLR